MADCLPLIDAAFLNLTTGADISDTAKTDSLILVVSALIGEELGGCVDPATASMRLKIVCAQYTSFVMESGSGGGGSAGNLRAEQIGDYRVEYQSSNKQDNFDLQTLREMLKSMYGGSAYTVTTTDTRVEYSMPVFDVFDPGYDDVADGRREGALMDFLGVALPTPAAPSTPPPSAPLLQVPGAPVDVAVGNWVGTTGPDWTFDITWSAPVDGGPPALYVVTIDGAQNIVPADATSLLGVPIKTGSDIPVSVVAVNPAGAGPGSAEVIASVPVSQPADHEFDLLIDLYSGSFVRVMSDSRLDDEQPHWVMPVLATVPGPNGEVFADIDALSAAGGVVWFDHGGSLGHVQTNMHTDLASTMLARYLHEGRTLQVQIDLADPDPSHPIMHILTTKLPPVA